MNQFSYLKFLISNSTAHFHFALLTFVFYNPQTKVCTFFTQIVLAPIFTNFVSNYLALSQFLPSLLFGPIVLLFSVVVHLMIQKTICLELLMLILLLVDFLDFHYSILRNLLLLQIHFCLKLSHRSSCHLIPKLKQRIVYILNLLDLIHL